MAAIFTITAHMYGFIKFVEFILEKINHQTPLKIIRDNSPFRYFTSKSCYIKPRRYEFY